jgi:hypothetical protein
MSSKLPTIQQLSTLPLVLGTSCFTNPEGTVGIKTEYIMASAAVRQASALERIAEALEQANELQRPQVIGATIGEGAGRIHLAASMEKGGKDISMQFSFSDPGKAAEFFENYAEHAKQVVDAANAKEGGQDV